MDVEEWKPITGFEGLYEVSNTGKIKALERLVLNNGGLQAKHEKILKQNKHKSGHCMVVLCKEGKTYPMIVHRIVAFEFIPNPENKPVVDHVDTDASNNHVENLRWVTQKENCNNPLTRKHGSEAKMGHPYWGNPHSEETRKKISEALKGKKLSDEHKKSMSLSRIGHHVSDETKEKISISHKGILAGKHWKLEGGKRVWY